MGQGYWNLTKVLIQKTTRVALSKNKKNGYCTKVSKDEWG
jgi:hypothetical protein